MTKIYELSCGFDPRESQCDRQGHCEGCPMATIERGEKMEINDFILKDIIATFPKAKINYSDNKIIARLPNPSVVDAARFAMLLELLPINGWAGDPDIYVDDNELVITGIPD